MAVSKQPGGKQIHLRNANGKKYQTREFDVSDVKIDTSAHEWSNYFLAGYKVLSSPFLSPSKKVMLSRRKNSGSLMNVFLLVCFLFLAEDP